MRVRRVVRRDILNAQFEQEMPAGRYAGIMVVWKGDMEDLKDSSLPDFGTIDVRFRDQNIVHARATELHAYTDLRGGLPTADNVTGGDYRYSFIIPFRYGLLKPTGGEDNVLNVGDGELYVSIPGVTSADYTTAYCDLIWLEDYGVARYIVQIGSMLHEYTGQDNIRLSVPNLRNILIQEPQGDGAFPNTVMMTQNGQVLVFGDFEQLLDQTSHENEIEAAMVGYCLPDFGNSNPLSWTGGKYFLDMVGATAADTSYIVQFGARFVKPQEFNKTLQDSRRVLVQNAADSFNAPASDIAPVEARLLPNEVSSGAPFRSARPVSSPLPVRRESV